MEETDWRRLRMWGLEEETVTAILGEGWGGSDGKEGGVDPGEALCIKQRLLKQCFSSARVWQMLIMQINVRQRQR